MMSGRILTSEEQIIYSIIQGKFNELEPIIAQSKVLKDQAFEDKAAELNDFLVLAGYLRTKEFEKFRTGLYAVLVSRERLGQESSEILKKINAIGIAVARYWPINNGVCPYSNNKITDKNRVMFNGFECDAGSDKVRAAFLSQKFASHTYKAYLKQKLIPEPMFSEAARLTATFIAGMVIAAAALAMMLTPGINLLVLFIGLGLAAMSMPLAISFLYAPLSLLKKMSPPPSEDQLLNEIDRTLKSPPKQDHSVQKTNSQGGILSRIRSRSSTEKADSLVEVELEEFTTTQAPLISPTISPRAMSDQDEQLQAYWFSQNSRNQFIAPPVSIVSPVSNKSDNSKGIEMARRMG